MADDVIRDVPSRGGMRLLDGLDVEKVSWGAIWAGVMVTIGLEALFLSFGVFINAVLGGSTVWSMAWYLVTMAVSFYGGAWSAARLSDTSIRGNSILHGLAMWGLATLVTAVAGFAIGSVWVGSLMTNPGARLGWGPTIQWAGLIWGGIVLAFVTAYAGGAAGMPEQIAVAGRTGEREPASPIRRAS